MSDLISRSAAIDAVQHAFDRETLLNSFVRKVAVDALKTMPSAQPEPPEITDEQAIEHLQATGWMQNHDREMYESGVRERLADDSESYDALIPCEDTISRQAAIHAMENCEPGEELFMIKSLPSVKPEYEPVTAEDFAKTMSENTIYTFMAWHGEALELMERQGFVICKKTM